MSVTGERGNRFRASEPVERQRETERGGEAGRERERER